MTQTVLTDMHGIYNKISRVIGGQQVSKCGGCRALQLVATKGNPNTPSDTIRQRSWPSIKPTLAQVYCRVLRFSKYSKGDSYNAEYNIK